MRGREQLYRDRFLSQGYPDLERLGGEYFKSLQTTESGVEEILACVGRLIDLGDGTSRVVDVGCGPNPANVKRLLELGYDAVGVEPVAPHVAAAREFLGEPERILAGCAERLPLADESVRVVLLRSVIEHTDSPQQCVSEAYRVLTPDGVFYISTPNRHHLSLVGANGEFRKRFYNWFPDVLKECYVFQHLHYDPRLANYTPRPAVHWFTYADLCKLGRSAGFGQFYTKIDLADRAGVYAHRSRWRRWLLGMVQRSVWLRALALTQIGHIIMWKRKEPRLDPVHEPHAGGR